MTGTSPRRRAEADAPPLPKSGQGGPVPVYVPNPVGRDATRGRSAQTFLTDEEAEALDIFLREIHFAKKDYLRWLITYALANRLRP